VGKLAAAADLTPANNAAVAATRRRGILFWLHIRHGQAVLGDAKGSLDEGAGDVVSVAHGHLHPSSRARLP
jgi:hypothetical protein